jgi:nucleoside-diphosphate-sugar epimerase
MKIAITGGTGFVGRTLARTLVAASHSVVLLARGVDRADPAIRQSPGVEFTPCGLDDAAQLTRAFAGCEAVVHCAGINRELGRETFHRVHVEGTWNVVQAARAAGVRKILLTSFLRARPGCGSPYHESKWAAEEVVRNSGLDYAVLKAGVIYGPGDHMLDHLSHAFHTFPVFGFVGFSDQPVRPVAVEDMARVMKAALESDALSRRTVAVLGPEQLTLREAVRRVAQVVGRRPLMFPLPLWIHYALAAVIEHIMVAPMVSTAQIRMLSEGLVEPHPPCDALPPGLAPETPFSPEQIRRGLPWAKAYQLSDLRCCRCVWEGGHA